MGGGGGAGKPPLRGGARPRLDDSGVGGLPGESFVAKYRREREASQLPEDMFAPKRSDQVSHLTDLIWSYSHIDANAT